MLKIIKNKQELKRIKEILLQLEQRKTKTALQDGFYLINTLEVNQIIEKVSRKSFEEKNSFPIESICAIITTWDDYGYISTDLGEKIENMLKQDNIILGIHRTRACDSNEKKSIYSSKMLHSILEEGLYITGDISSGVDHKGEVISPNKNISPINSILEAVMYLKSSYKSSNGGIITAIPKEFVTNSYNIKPGHQSDIYYKLENQWTLKPEYIVGYVSQENGVCDFYSKEEVLKNYNINKSK